jgi:hypothetical protein
MKLVSPVFVLASLFTAVSAKEKSELSTEPEHNQTEVDRTIECKLFEVEDAFAGRNIPARVDLRYNCDKEPITFVKTLHEEEKYLMVWRGQGVDSEDDVVSISVATDKKGVIFSG